MNAVRYLESRSKFRSEQFLEAGGNALMGTLASAGLGYYALKGGPLPVEVNASAAVAGGLVAAKNALVAVTQFAGVRIIQRELAQHQESLKVAMQPPVAEPEQLPEQ